MPAAAGGGPAGTPPPVTASGASGFGLWIPGLPGPDPPRVDASEGAGSGPGRCFVSDGFTFVRTKVNRKSAKTKVLDSFVQSDAIRICRCVATEGAKSFGDPICDGFLNDASAVGPVKGIHASVFLCRTACGWGNCSAPVNKNLQNPHPEGPCRKKNRNHSQHEGRQAKSDTPPHWLRGGRRPGGNSTAAEPQVTPRPIRQKKGGRGLPGVLLPTFPAREK